MQCICSAKLRKRAELCERNSKISTIRFFYSIFYAARCSRAGCRTSCSLQRRPFPARNISTCSSAVVLHTREALTARLARSRRPSLWVTCAIVSKTTTQARFRFPPLLLHQPLLITLVGLPSCWHPLDVATLHSAVPFLPPEWVLGGPRSIFPAPPCSRGAVEESDRAGDTASAQPRTPTPVWGTRICATAPKNVREGSKKGTKGTAGRPGSSAGSAEKKQDRKRSEI